MKKLLIALAAAATVQFASADWSFLGWFSSDPKESPSAESNAAWDEAPAIENDKYVIDGLSTLTPEQEAAPDTNTVTKIVVNAAMTLSMSDLLEEPDSDAQTAFAAAYDANSETNYYAWLGSEWIALEGATPGDGTTDTRLTVELDYSAGAKARFSIGEEGSSTVLSTNGVTWFDLDTPKTQVSALAFSGSGTISSVEGAVGGGVAAIAGVKYGSVADAVAAAVADDTVTLLSDSAEVFTLPYGVSFVVNGYTFNGEVQAANGYKVAENDGTYTIVDNTASEWIGTAGGSWSTAANWSTGYVPDQYTTVTLPDGAQISVTGTAAIPVDSLVVNGTATITCTGGLGSNWPSIGIYGNATGTGTLKLERVGLKAFGTGAVEVGCNVYFDGKGYDCFLESGSFVFNGSFSGTNRCDILTTTTFNGAVTIPDGATLRIGKDGTYPTVSFGSAATLSGDGTIVIWSNNYNAMNAVALAPIKAKLQAAAWEGVCELSGTMQQIDFGYFGNSGSIVRANGLTGFLRFSLGNTTEIANGIAALDIGSNGFTMNNQFTSGNANGYIFGAPLTGSGTIAFGTKHSQTGDSLYTFTGDVTGFSGVINYGSLSSYRPIVVFRNTDEPDPTATDYGQIIVSAAKTVNVNGTWYGAGGYQIYGKVNMAAGAQLTCDDEGQKICGDGVISYSAKPTISGSFKFNDSWTGSAVLDYKGADRIDLADYVNKIAEVCACDTVEIAAGSTIPGNSYLNVDVVPKLKVSGFVSINDGSSYTKRTVPTITGDGVLVFGTGGGKVNYAVDNVVGWNGVITNNSTAAFVTNIVSGTGKVVYPVFPESAGAPVVGSGFSGEVVLGFNANQKAIQYYGGANSTIVLMDISGNNTYLPNGDINSKVRVDGAVTINNGNPLAASELTWNHERVIQMPVLKVDGTLKFEKATISGSGSKSWNPGYVAYYYANVLDASGAGTIEVGTQFALRIDAVDFDAAPQGEDCLVAFSLTNNGDADKDVGCLYGPNGVAGENIPVTVNGEATEQSLVYDAAKGGLVLYVPPQQVTIDIPTVANTTASVTENGEPVEIVNGQITVADGAAVVLTYTSETHEVTGGTIEFTAAEGYTVDVSSVTTAEYVASFNSVKYTTLQGAVDAWADAESMVAYMNTVNLLDDVTVVSITVPSRLDDVPMQLAGGNHTLTGPVTIAAGATLSTANTSFVGDMTVNGTLYTMTALSIDGDLVFGDGASIFTTSLDSESAVLTATGDVTVSGDLAVQLVSDTLVAGSYPLVTGDSMSADNAQATVYLNHVEDPNWAFSVTATSLVLTGAAAKVGDHTYATFEEAVTAAAGVSTIELLNNVSYTLAVDETVVVKAGSFTFTPAAPNGYVIATTDLGEGVVSYTTALAVAKTTRERNDGGTWTVMSEVSYASLAEAVAAVEEADPMVVRYTVTLLANVTLSARIGVTETMTIDLAGYTITRTAAPNGDNGSAFRVDGSVTVTIKSGTIDCSGVDDSTVLGDGVFAIDAKNGAALTLASLDVSVNSKNGACVYPWTGSTVVIRGGTYANTTSAYYSYGQFKDVAKGMTVNQANVAQQLITIYGGSFKQIDPMLGDDSWEPGDGTFMAAGKTTKWNASTGYWDVVDASTVTFTVDDSTFATVIVATGDAVQAPDPAPTKEGFLFDGWLLNDEAYDFETPVTSDIELVASWTEDVPAVPTIDGEPVADAEAFIAKATSATANAIPSGWTVSGNNVYDQNGDLYATFPAFYNVQASEGVVALTLNGNAVPTIGATPEGEEQEAIPAMDVGAAAVSVGVTSTSTKLYYGLSTCNTPGGVFAAPATLVRGTGKAMALTATRAENETFKFYKVYVTDVAPAPSGD